MQSSSMTTLLLPAIKMAGRSIEPIVVVVILAAAQWLLFLAMSTCSRKPSPSHGLRATERNLIISTVVMALVWLVAFGPSPSATSADSTRTSATTESNGKKHFGSCASIRIGMTSSEVRHRLGDPDDTRNDEATRGPSAATLVYRDSRCAVHTLDDRVEFID